MSSFRCETCQTPIIDTPKGYVTGCEHYPLINGAWGKIYYQHLRRGHGNGPAAYAADAYCAKAVKKALKSNAA